MLDCPFDIFFLSENGSPDQFKQYTLAFAGAYNMEKIKADLSEMFGDPIETIFNLHGQKVG